MLGIGMTREIHTEFTDRIKFLNDRLSELKAIPRRDRVNGEWQSKVLIVRNELGLRERIIKDAMIVDDVVEMIDYVRK